MSGASGDGVPPDAPDDLDAGEPIAALAGLEEPTSDGFVERVHHALDRRALSSQVSSLWWEVPKLVLLEFLRMIFDLFDPTDPRKGDAQ